MNKKDSEFKEMTLIDHITELRKRLLWSFLYVLIIFVACFYYADNLFAFLLWPKFKYGCLSVVYLYGLTKFLNT